MTYQEVISEYLTFLWRMFQYDIEVFSKGWLYYWILIPATFYFVFYIVKWVVLTCPIWMPISIIASTIKSIYSDEKSIKK